MIKAKTSDANEEVDIDYCSFIDQGRHTQRLEEESRSLDIELKESYLELEIARKRAQISSNKKEIHELKNNYWRSGHMMEV